MKRVLFLATLIALFSPDLVGQYDLDGNFNVNFDNEYGLNHLKIDTITNPINIWQIGVPKKGLFNIAKSSPNVIITDTTNPYPQNDTSFFIITNTALGYGFEWPHTVVLSGWYNVDTDSLTDYGKIEFSPDNGTTWIDMLNDTVIIDTLSQWDWYWDSFSKPVLTGNSNGWKNFYTNLSALGYAYDVEFGDTVLYRFTFISDSIQSNKSGLMYDDLHFEDWVESGIKEQGYEFIQNICYPNPSESLLIIEFENIENDLFELKIFNINGKQVLQKQNSNSNVIEVNIYYLTSGIYYYRIKNREKKIASIGKFVKK